MKVAIDAMGGDLAPQSTVEGAIEAAKEWKDVEIILVGDKGIIEPLLHTSLSNISIHHTDEVINAEDEPVNSVRRKKNASMVVAGRLVREKQVDAMISAGNTGALMVTGTLVVGRMKGIERPALAPMLPTMNGKGVLALDLGANMDATPENLLQYAIMGNLYRNKVHGMERPRIGLLNVGSESGKGNELTRAAYPLLSEASFHFIGNIEARDILNSKCDVIVCDGFAGNILLKGMEGAASTIIDELKVQFKRNIWTKLAAVIMKPGLKSFFQKLDYGEHGAAPLLGLSGLVLKAHGPSDANAIKNAVRQARIAIKAELVEGISAEISRNK